MTQNRLYLYRPEIYDVIDPRTFAVSGQVVTVVKYAEFGDQAMCMINGVDGTDLGYVSARSLFPIPKGYFYNTGSGIPDGMVS